MSTKSSPLKERSYTRGFFGEVHVHDESLLTQGTDSASAVYGTSQCELPGYIWLVNKEDFSNSLIFPFASKILNLSFS